MQYAALVAIAANPGIDATRLSQRIFFDRSTIGSVLDRLESKGWILRESAPDDRRVKSLTLSASGVAVLEKAEPAVHRVQQRLLAPLSPDEADVMVQLLRKVANAE